MQLSFRCVWMKVEMTCLQWGYCDLGLAHELICVAAETSPSWWLRSVFRHRNLVKNSCAGTNPPPDKKTVVHKGMRVRAQRGCLGSGVGWMWRVFQSLTGGRGWWCWDVGGVSHSHAGCLHWHTGPVQYYSTLASLFGIVCFASCLHIQTHMLVCKQLVNIQANRRHRGTRLLATGKAGAWSESKTEQRGKTASQRTATEFQLWERCRRTTLTPLTSNTQGRKKGRLEALKSFCICFSKLLRFSTGNKCLPSSAF